MNLTRYNPMSDFEQFFDRMNWPLGRDNGFQAMTRADWLPSVDISEGKDEYLIKVEVPEVKKEDIKININNGMLSINGERRQEKEDKKHHRVERSYGSFSRSFTLPDDVSDENIKAEQKDGMLYLHLAKSQAKQPKSVEIKVK